MRLAARDFLELLYDTFSDIPQAAASVLGTDFARLVRMAHVKTTPDWSDQDIILKDFYYLLPTRPDLQLQLQAASRNDPHSPEELVSHLPSLPDGSLIDIFRRWPENARAFLAYFQQVMRTPCGLTAGRRELLAAFVSWLNGNFSRRSSRG